MHERLCAMDSCKELGTVATDRKARHPVILSHKL
jgi:hypothetical protein